MDWSISLGNVLVIAVAVACLMALVFGKWEEGTPLYAAGRGLGKLLLTGLVFWAGWGACLHMQLNGKTASVAPSIPVETAECLEAKGQLKQVRAEYDELLDELAQAPQKVARR